MPFFLLLPLLLLIDQALDIISKRLESNKRPISFILLLDDIRMLEVVFQLSSTLYPRIAHLTHLRAVELLPCMVVELSIEVLDELGVDKVQKCVANVAIVLCYRRGTL